MCLPSVVLGVGGGESLPYLDNRKNLTFETSKLSSRFAIMSHMSAKIEEKLLF